jgi:hypothetical protein
MRLAMFNLSFQPNFEKTVSGSQPLMNHWACKRGLTPEVSTEHFIMHIEKVLAMTKPERRITNCE